jgi:hypothetical protein
MKRYLFLIGLFILSVACEPEDKESQNSFEDFKENDFDFTLDKKLTYKNLQMTVPSSFKKYYGKYLTVSNDSKVLFCNAIGAHFSIERFTEKDINRPFVQDLIIEKDLLNTFQDGYALKRYNSLNDGTMSIKKDLFSTSKKRGVIQIVRGSTTNLYSEFLLYATATIQLKDEYYVFQFITTPDMMNYAYDDFRRMLYSVKAIK